MARQEGNFRQETEALEREGALAVWPYSVRRDATTAQRRLRAAREFVDTSRAAGASAGSGGDGSDSGRGGGMGSASGSATVAFPGGVQYLPPHEPSMTEAQRLVRREDEKTCVFRICRV